jgi:hypothetical protein
VVFKSHTLYLPNVASNSMRQVCLTILALISIPVWGQQVRPVGKVYVDGRELDVIAHGPPYFEFNEYDTTLTATAKEYLDDFGQSYKDSLYNKRNFLIELTPGLTEKEREKDKDLGVKRLKTIINYLERNYGIDKSEFRARYSETATTDGCVGFIVKENNPKKTTRREKKILKKEEDNYFREE